jgi:hypothetical protein
LLLRPDELRELVSEAVEEACRSRPDIPASQQKEWLSNAEARAYLGCSSATLQRWRRAEMLPYSKVDGLIFYRLADIHSVLEDRVQGRRQKYQFGTSACFCDFSATTTYLPKLWSSATLHGLVYHVSSCPASLLIP